MRNNNGQFVKGHTLYKDRGFSYMKKTGELNNNWKGSKVSYHGIHKWIGKKLGIPDKCDKCKKILSITKGRRSIHWANVSGKYKRDFNDWIALCTLCHTAFDKKNKIDFKEVSVIKDLVKRGKSQTSVAKKYGVDQMTISRIITGITNGKKNCYAEK